MTSEGKLLVSKEVLHKIRDLVTELRSIDPTVQVVSALNESQKLVIEIDGITHINRKKYDKNRQKKLESIGISILRFDGNYVISNTEGVLYKIEEWMKNQETYTIL